MIGLRLAIRSTITLQHKITADNTVIGVYGRSEQENFIYRTTSGSGILSRDKRLTEVCRRANFVVGSDSITKLRAALRYGSSNIFY